MVNDHFANREVVKLFSGEAAKCDMNFLSQNPEGVFIFGSLSLGLGS